MEMRYEKALRPVFGDQLRIIHDSDDFASIILDGEQEDFFFTLSCVLYDFVNLKK